MKLFAILVLAVLVVVTSSAAWAGELLSVLDEPPVCRQAGQPISLEAGYLEDPQKLLVASQVAEMAAGTFTPVGRDGWQPHFTHSAYWFRITLNNVGGPSCLRELIVGSPRLERVELYFQGPEGLEMWAAGSDIPLDEWPVKTRQPRFTLSIPEDSSQPVWVRVESKSLIAVDPELWPEAMLDNHIAAQQLLEGGVIGAALVVVLSGLLAALVYQSYLLAFSSVGLLCYLLVTLIANGYLFYLPELLPLSRTLVAMLTTIVFAMFFSFVYLLFRVNRLPVWVRALVATYVVCGAGILLWGVIGDFPESRHVFSQFRYGTYLLLPALVVVSLVCGVRLGFLAWFLAGIMLFQGVSVITRSLLAPSMYFGEDLFGVNSNLVMLALVVVAVLSLSRDGRRREISARRRLIAVQENSRKRLQQMVELRTAQLKRSLSARELMVARVGHDLRAPLAGIIHQAQSMEGSEEARYIERQARQQLMLLDDLILLSGKDLALSEQNLQAGFLYAFLDEIEDDASLYTEQRGNRFVAEISSQLPPLVQIDFKPLRRVLLNLLGNAAKYTRDGRVTLRVERLARERDLVHLRFEVTDTGVGVPRELRDRLTQPFLRGEQVASIEGYGIGLSVVEELLGKMHSRLEVYDNHPVGSVFAFNLATPVANESEVATVIEERNAREIDGEGCRVVVVDDVELTRAFIGEILGGYGFDVEAVPDGLKALEVLARSSVDLLITDQLMPDMDGWALLSEVRGRYPELPVMLYSSMPPSPVAKPYGAAFDATLLKPAPSDEFLVLVQRLCRRRRQPEAAGHSDSVSSSA